MSQTNLLEFIKSALRRGYSGEQIHQALLEKGWNEKLVDESIRNIKETINQEKTQTLVVPTPPKKSEWNIELKSLSASQILLYLGGFIVVLAAIIYFGINWSQWGTLGRIFAILLPMLICYTIGVPMWLSGKNKKQAMVFIMTASLLFPFFMAVTFKELSVFAKPYNNSFNLTVSSITFALYLISSFIFRFPGWSFLYYGSGTFVYYYFFQVIGITEFFKGPTMAWLMLVLGTVYLFLSIRLGLKEKNKESDYPYIIGFFIIVMSLVNLFTESFRNDYVVWLLLILGVLYFALGVLLEANFKKFHPGCYLIGAGLLFFSLLRLGIDGTLLKAFSTGNKTSHDLVGWSSVIVGFIYMLIAWVMGNLKKYQLKSAMAFKEFFTLMGTFWILGAIHFLGLNGHKLIYETLLLLTSLGFIFGSLPLKKIQYLYIGTLFLIIYIFSIGSEYFQNDVGWPITLFIAGLLSMGIGVSIERVRKKFFAKGKIST